MLERVRQRLEAAHAPGGDLLAHPRHRGRRGAKLAPAMHQVHARRARQQLERPVERRVAPAEDHQALAGELGGVADAVLDGAALERLAALDPDAPRLEGAEAAGDHHRAGIETHPAGGLQVEASVVPARELHHLVAEVKLGLEGLDLLQQPVDQLLRAAHRQRRDVIDRLVRVELGALPAGVREGVEDVGADAEQARARRPGTARRGRRQ